MMLTSPGCSKSTVVAVARKILAEMQALSSNKHALLSGNDCTIIQPTGSGKSLCFQFPSVYTNKIAVVITLTISLMQDHDHVTNCEKYGIKAIFLGSAQLDLNAEEYVLSGESDAKIVLVTPDWISKPDKKVSC